MVPRYVLIRYRQYSLVFGRLSIRFTYGYLHFVEIVPYFGASRNRSPILCDESQYSPSTGKLSSSLVPFTERDKVISVIRDIEDILEFENIFVAITP